MLAGHRRRLHHLAGLSELDQLREAGVGVDLLLHRRELHQFAGELVEPHIGCLHMTQRVKKPRFGGLFAIKIVTWVYLLASQ